MQKRKSALGAAFAKYEEASYTSANWAAIEKAKADGEAAIDQAASLDEINDAKNQAIAEMAKILTEEQEEECFESEYRSFRPAASELRQVWSARSISS